MKPLNLKVLNAEAIAKVKGGRRNGENNSSRDSWNILPD